MLNKEEQAKYDIIIEQYKIVKEQFIEIKNNNISEELYNKMNALSQSVIDLKNLIMRNHLDFSSNKYYSLLSNIDKGFLRPEIEAYQKKNNERLKQKSEEIIKKLIEQTNDNVYTIGIHHVGSTSGELHSNIDEINSSILSNGLISEQIQIFGLPATVVIRGYDEPEKKYNI